MTGALIATVVFLARMIAALSAVALVTLVGSVAIRRKPKPVESKPKPAPVVWYSYLPNALRSGERVNIVRYWDEATKSSCETRTIPPDWPVVDVAGAAEHMKAIRREGDA